MNKTPFSWAAVVSITTWMLFGLLVAGVDDNTQSPMLRAIAMAWAAINATFGILLLIRSEIQRHSEQ